MTYLRNCWYVAAWSSELTPGATLARTYLDIPVVLYRDQEGEPVALFDRCPHRFAPLSQGRLVGDAIQCPYHGLEFGADGQCVANPYGPVLRAATIPSYPVVERYRAIWIWMGVTQRADPNLIPDFSYLSDVPATAFSSGYIHGDANYEIFVDNIMDLTHSEYLHAGSIAGSGMTGKPGRVKEAGERITVEWLSENAAMPPLYAKLLPDHPIVDSRVSVTWHSPSLLRLSFWLTPPGRPAEESLQSENAHLLTPETAKASHYFFASTRNFQQEDEALNRGIGEGRARVFKLEDGPILEAVQRRMGQQEFWSLKPLLLNVDEGPIRVRRALKKLIDAEAQPEPKADEMEFG